MILQSSSLYFPKGSQEVVFWEKYQALCSAPDAHKAIIADFHRTLSVADEPTTWSIPARSGLLSSSYVAARDELYDVYRPQEIDESIDIHERDRIVGEWFQKHLDLLSKPEYALTHDDFRRALDVVLPHNLFRPGIPELLLQLHAQKIPLVLVSGGLGNFINLRFERENIPQDFISLESNTLLYGPDGKVGGRARQDFITSMNKGTIVLSERSHNFLAHASSLLLLGDDIEDLALTRHVPGATTLRIAYCSKGHDAVYFDNSGYDAVYLHEDAYWMADIVTKTHPAPSPLGGVFFRGSLFA